MKFSDLRLSTDRIVSLSAMMVGVGSLFIITYQTRTTRRPCRTRWGRNTGPDSGRSRVQPSRSARQWMPGLPIAKATPTGENALLLTQ